MDVAQCSTLESLELSSIQFRILDLIAEGPLCGWDELQIIKSIAQETDGGQSQPRAYQITGQEVALLKSKDLIQVISAAELKKIQKRVSTEQCLGPFNILPQEGDFDFTLRGAVVWEGLERQIWGKCEWAYSTSWEDDRDGVRTRTVVGTSREAVLEMVHSDKSEIGTSAIIQITAPRPIGPWRFSWWQYFKSGFLAELTYRGIDSKGNQISI